VVSIKELDLTHNFNFNRDLAKCKPRDKNTVEHEQNHQAVEGKFTISS
jgi:hypothetical protein